MKFDNYNVSNTHQKCHVPNEPYNDYEDIHNELSKSASRIRENEQLMRQLSLCLKHVVRKLHCLFIKKCKSDGCAHCSSHPVKAKHAMSFLWEHCGLPSPFP